MGGMNTDAGEAYPAPVAFVYIFNLIVGVGALALPIGFFHAGLFLGIIFLACLAFLAFVTVTWVNEAQATANAVLALREKEARELSPEVKEISSDLQSINQDESSHETTSLLEGGNGSLDSNIFEIKRRVEMGLMADLFMGSIGKAVFYVIMIAYLYGDLAIYAVTVPISLAAVTNGFSLGSVSLNAEDAYYLYLTMFAVLLVPWTFFNFQKTKYLQLFTIGTRNVALFTMIILGLIYIGEGNGARLQNLKWFDITGLPALFGVSIYAFMCHHSLPSLITPVRNKKQLTKLLGTDFITIYSVYILLCISALFAFGDNSNAHCKSYPSASCSIQSLYTLNFTSYNIRPIAIFLALFPVFTLSTNFPLIAITLRNNLMVLIPIGESHPKLRQAGFGLLASILPIGVAYTTRDVDMLVNITGSFAGLGIMFFIPAALLVWSRRAITRIGVEKKIQFTNPHRSPFGHNVFIAVVMIAACGSLVLAAVNLVYSNTHKHL